MGRAFKARDVAWEQQRKLYRGEFERMSRNYLSEIEAGPFQAVELVCI